MVILETRSLTAVFALAVLTAVVLALAGTQLVWDYGPRYHKSWETHPGGALETGSQV